MRTYIHIAATILAFVAGQAKASPLSTIVFDRGGFHIVDHHRLPQPKVEQIAKGIHIDPRLLRELQTTAKKKDR